MDGNTEPIIAVIGHPIAGNPSQFAIECALKSLRLEYRVSSFDVAPENLSAALDGLEVLHFQGVLADDVLAPLVAQWCATRSERVDSIAPIHCLFRDPENENTFLPHDCQASWLIEAVNAHLQKHDATLTDSLWLGARRNIAFPSEIVSKNEMMHFTRTPQIESVEQADLIVIAPGPKKAVRLEADEWPENDGSTLVIDFSGGHDELALVRQKGYTTLSHRARRIGMIGQSLLRWTGQAASETIIYEAIEEYLAV